MSWRKVAHLDDLPDRRGWPVSVDHQLVALFRTDEGVAAVDNVCRHVGAPLDDGFVEDGCVTCPWHGWRYDLATGDQVTAFGRKPGLRRYPVRVSPDGSIWVDASLPAGAPR